MTAPRAGAWWARMPDPVVDALVVLIAVVDVVLNLWGASPLTTGIAAGGCAALALRRRFPLAVFACTLPVALMLDVVFAPLAALFTLAERSRDRRLLGMCALLFGLASATPWPLNDISPHDRNWTVVYFFYTLATAAAPVLLGQLVQARRDLAGRLVEIEDAREHERLLHSQAVLARERAQLAREMHDVVSHQVSLIAVQAGALQVAARDPAAKEGARTIRSLSVDTLDELRHMVTLLRASGGRATELTPQPTLADLHRLVTTSGIEADLTGELPPDIGTPAQRAVYRTVQEALTNVRKHAPGATAAVRLRCAADGSSYGVTVTNGPVLRPSLPLPGSRQGLVGLRERAELLGGTLESGPTSDGGWEVTLRIPAPDSAGPLPARPPL
ncbi:sensor histidine kinase [Streptomyces caniscabiei]|uniref:histidine kinase n=2 Tax=Streptomyces caniscabiei TaxID=2746961 RepID=A0ABU4MTL4_9ACTN|nr:histidine kinase [Streptomyces caniscabiei]MDX2941923.1 histidine kinase [Streptomyces caniscabiei]MDX2986143.1 histidine kinase [Streptomyces caniscabiei]MDX3012844.1 histidine kinase [Streptomyces caniscabiei]MDX3040801.1 histidine kinase [Streptomyces caniscabiei]